ncbi:MAG: radical SAM protein [Phycisphaerales bacterium]|nr:radical SAM protein [Phycisphaerales bacterium]
MSHSEASDVRPTSAATGDAGERSATLRINEVFYSIQGESTWAGCPCVFVRLAGCHLRCTYCDTEYAFREGASRPIEALLDEVLAIDCSLVEVTGGEPLLQPRVHELISRLCDAGRTVLVETSGACDLSPLDPRSVAIVDVKTPASGEVQRNDWSNLARLRPQDEVKFVIADRNDYEFAKGVIAQHGLIDRCRAVLLSAVFEQPKGLEILGCRGLPPRTLAEWILADRLGVRMQTQLHKHIWEPSTRGV